MISSNRSSFIKSDIATILQAKVFRDVCEITDTIVSTRLEAFDNPA